LPVLLISLILIANSGKEDGEPEIATELTATTTKGGCYEHG
jgi:hypothetical protein